MAAHEALNGCERATRAPVADELSCARPALLLKPNESNRYQWANRNSQISNRPRRITDQSIDHPDLGDEQISGTNIMASKGFNQTLIYVTHTATSLQTSPDFFTLAARIHKDGSLASRPRSLVLPLYIHHPHFVTSTPIRSTTCIKKSAPAKDRGQDGVGAHSQRTK